MPDNLAFSNIRKVAHNNLSSFLVKEREVALRRVFLMLDEACLSGGGRELREERRKTTCSTSIDPFRTKIRQKGKDCWELKKKTAFSSSPAVRFLAAIFVHKSFKNPGEFRSSSSSKRGLSIFLKQKKRRRREKRVKGNFLHPFISFISKARTTFFVMFKQCVFALIAVDFGASLSFMIMNGRSVDRRCRLPAFMSGLLRHYN